MEGAYNLEWLFTNIKTENDAIEFFQRFNIIPRTNQCKNGHEIKVKYLTSEGRHVWFCSTSPCRSVKKSIRKGNWLEGSILPLRKILLVIYCWAEELTSIRFCETQLKISAPTTVDYNSVLREVCAATLVNQPRSIGGEDKTVEIDYTYFHKRQNEEGKMVPEQWVFGGICRETEEVFLCTIPETTEDAIIESIKKNIEPGTTIISDCQPPYKNIGNIEGSQYKHYMINDSENDLDPSLNANIQAIENIWFILNLRNKKHCGTNRKMLDSYLSEFVWRRRYGNKDLFENILKDIAAFQASKMPPPRSSSSAPGNAGNSGEEKVKKRKRKKENGSKSQESESTLPRMNIVDVPSNSRLKVVLDADPLQSSGIRDNFMHEQSCVREFNLFGKSVANRLNRMPRNGAVQLRLKIEELVTNFKLKMSFITPHNSLEEFDDKKNFIDVKMEIKEEFIE